MLDWLRALGARPHNARLLFFWRRYSSPVTVVPLNGVPWLCHVTPPSIVPLTVMPFQVSGQFVTTKSSRLLQLAGCNGAFVLTAGTAFVIKVSSADAPVAPAENSSRPDSAVCQVMRAIAPLRRSLA